MQSSGQCDSEGGCNGPYICESGSNLCCPVQLNIGRKFVLEMFMPQILTEDSGAFILGLSVYFLYQPAVTHDSKVMGSNPLKPPMSGYANHVKEP